MLKSYILEPLADYRPVREKTYLERQIPTARINLRPTADFTVGSFSHLEVVYDCCLSHQVHDFLTIATCISFLETWKKKPTVKTL